MKPLPSPSSVRRSRRFVPLLLLAFASCTSIEVEPLPAGIEAVAIVQNTAVAVEDFVPVLREALERRGLKTRIVADEPVGEGAVSATYTALRSWDLGTYLSEADVWFRRDGRQIARVHYHLIGKGGLSFYKWQSVEEKMTPAYDELLQSYPLVERR